MITIIFFIFLFTAEYSRKETVRGFITPNKGVIKSYALQGGAIDKILVKEGSKVMKGQSLVSIIIRRNGFNGDDLSSELVRQLEDQLSLLENDVTETNVISNHETENLIERKLSLHREQNILGDQMELVQSKLDLLESQQVKLTSLNKKGFLSRFEKEEKMQILLSAQQELKNAARLLEQKNGELRKIDFDIKSTKQQYGLRINSLRRLQAEIGRDLAQVKNNHVYTITATHDGIVTGVQVVEGEMVTQTKPLLHIIPDGSHMVAELLLPTRSAGFVQKGDITHLRFDAFPYQRFGFSKGKITRIDKALINPNELSLPVSFQEPIYRLRASLGTQDVKAFGKVFPLKSGMLFEADIMLEKRSLFEWILEPIFSVTGRVG